MHSALAIALALSLSGAPKADVTIQLRVDEYPRADDAGLMATAREQALDQVLRGRLGEALVVENRERVLAALAPEPYHYLTALLARRVVQPNSLGMEDEFFTASFAVSNEIGPPLARLQQELASLPRPRVLFVRSEAGPEAPHDPKAKPAGAKPGKPGNSFAEVVTRTQGRLAALGWRFLAQEEVAARVPKSKGAPDLEAVRAAGLVGPGDVVVFVSSETTAETGIVVGLTNIHTELAWRAVDAASGDLLSANARVFSTPTVTESFERGYEAAAQGLTEQVQTRVLTAWRQHGAPTGGVVVVVNGVEFEVLTQLRDTLGKLAEAKVAEATFTDGSAQVRLQTLLSADRVAEQVSGARLGKGTARVSRVSSGRVELGIK